MRMSDSPLEGGAGRRGMFLLNFMTLPQGLGGPVCRQGGARIGRPQVSPLRYRITAHRNM